MQRGSILVRAVVGLLCLGVLGVAGGCAGKRVAASSGDASSTVKEKKTTDSIETVSPDPMVTIPPDDRRSTTETSDTPPISSVSGDTETPSPPPSRLPSPSSSSLMEEAGAKDVSTPADLSGLGDVFFDFDQFVIRGDALPVMEANAAWIMRNSGKSILIEGHCDERGTMAYNLVLGEKRARAAKRYLEDLGIPPRGLKTISYGEVRPLCREQNERCYQLNRRAHFVAQ